MEALEEQEDHELNLLLRPAQFYKIEEDLQKECFDRVDTMSTT